MLFGSTAAPSASFGSATGLALLGLRNDNSPEYMEKQYNIARVPGGLSTWHSNSGALMIRILLFRVYVKAPGRALQS